MLGLMSVPQENRRSTLLEWVKDSGLLTITILGLLLYALFAIPTTAFYYLLGASLAEVGVTYTSLLSGSALGLMVIVLAVVYLVTLSYGTYVLVRRSRAMLSKGPRKGSLIADNPRAYVCIIRE